jgi:thiamine biosynthesis lipoprotein
VQRSLTWSALGTGVTVLVGDARDLQAASEAVREVLAEVDRACSRFREDSEISALNRQTGRCVQVGDVLLGALMVALRAARLTAGDLDPTIGRALVLCGYDRDFSELPPAPTPRPAALPAERQPLLERPAGERRRLVVNARSSWRAIELDVQRRTVRLPVGVRLDLGATAKAWAADRAALAAHERTGAGVLVSLGGDIALGGPAPASGWRVLVAEDHRVPLNGPGQQIRLHAGGLATSTTTVRRWKHDGASMHHILDPATRRPVDGPWRTATVAAATCVDANVASTTALIRGARAPGWLGSLDLPARLIDQRGRALAIGGWPAEPDAFLQAERVPLPIAG